uniref:Uncharacterized protein n=2 Tax=Anguilla anguilla TaxID=7936 RepID=A0A0E9PH72_ANGAN
MKMKQGALSYLQHTPSANIECWHPVGLSIASTDFHFINMAAGCLVEACSRMVLSEF